MFFSHETIRYTRNSQILPRLSFSGYYRVRLFNQLIELEDTPYYTGKSKEDILEAVKNSELILRNNRRFLSRDLAAWVESKRPNTPFFRDGVSSKIPDISESNINMIESIAKEAVEKGQIGIQAHQLDSYGRVHIERIREIFDIPELDSFIYNWKEMHDFCRSVYKKPYHVCNIAFVISHSHVPNMTTHIDPQWLETRNRVDPTFIIGINITDAALSDGGVYYLLGSHRVSGHEYGRQVDSSFVPRPSHLGAVYVHNRGIIHGCYPNFSGQVRLNFYITLMSMDEMSLRTSYLKVRPNYTFE